MDGLFFDLDATSRRLPGVTAGQQDLLVVLDRLANGAGRWSGPRSTLASALRVSVDTVTRRKDALVELGLLSVVPCGRSLTYSVLRAGVQTALAECDRRAPSRRSTTAPRRSRAWYRLPDCNQLSLPFVDCESRLDAARRLASTTLQMLSLVLTLVVGPAARTTTRKASSVVVAAGVPELTDFADASPRPSRDEPHGTAATAAKREAPAAIETQNTVSPAASPAERPHTIEPISTSITIPTTAELISKPIQPIGVEHGSLKKFCLWRNAKSEEFKDAVKVQEIFERLLAAGGCTVDERLHLFRFVANTIRLAKPTDNPPALITAVLRGAGSPWRARGDESDESVARQQIRSLDVNLEMQTRSSDLLEGESIEAKRRDAKRQLAKLVSRRKS